MKWSFLDMVSTSIYIKRKAQTRLRIKKIKTMRQSYY